MISIDGAKEKCKDDISKIENYEQAINDKENRWVCHHRLEFTLNGEFAHTWKELERLGMYWKRPYFELIFMKENEHKSLHWIGKKLRKGTKHSEESKQKMRKAHKGHGGCKPYTEFGIKFIEHYGLEQQDNKKLRHTEYVWYLRHNNKCRWE